MTIDAVIRRMAAETAKELAAFCVERGLVYANERDHLAKCCKIAADQVRSSLDPPPAVAPLAFGEPHGWIGLGSVDVVLRWATGGATFVELKCGSDNHALRPCVWDAAKLATGLLGGNAGAGYLLAARPPPSGGKASLGPSSFSRPSGRRSAPRSGSGLSTTGGSGRARDTSRAGCPQRSEPSRSALTCWRSPRRHGSFASRALNRSARLGSCGQGP
jgi:hypothetical protein